MKSPGHVPHGAAGVPTCGKLAHLLSLPVQPLFRAKNACVPHIWIRQTVPPALSSALFDVERTFARSHHGVSDDAQQITTPKASLCTHQITVKACVWQSRTTLTNADSPYSQMFAPPRRFAMPALHSPTRTKTGTKGGGQHGTH
jgi:hypothetical protein